MQGRAADPSSPTPEVCGTVGGPAAGKTCQKKWSYRDGGATIQVTGCISTTQHTPYNAGKNANSDVPQTGMWCATTAVYNRANKGSRDDWGWCACNAEAGVKAHQKDNLNMMNAMELARKLNTMEEKQWLKNALDKAAVNKDVPKFDVVLSKEECTTDGGFEPQASKCYPKFTFGKNTYQGCADMASAKPLITTGAREPVLAGTSKEKWCSTAKVYTTPSLRRSGAIAAAPRRPSREASATKPSSTGSSTRSLSCATPLASRSAKPLKNYVNTM